MKLNFLYFFLSTILTLFISCSNESLQKIGVTKKNNWGLFQKAPLEMPPDMFLRPTKLKIKQKKKLKLRR